GVEAVVRNAAADMIAAYGMKSVDLRIDLPNLAAHWMIGNLATLLADLGSQWPSCAPLLTDEVATGLYVSQSLYNLKTAAVSEELRVRAYRAMAEAFEHVDFIIASTNPGPAFSADAAMSSSGKGIVDWAKSNSVGQSAFRASLASVRFASAALPSLPSW